jgi:cytochrome c oxidase subunit 2
MNTTTRAILIAIILGGLSSISVFYSKPVMSAGAEKIARQEPSKSEEKVIQIKAKKFEFSPSTITLKKGEPVVFELTSEDRTHGFNLKDFDVRTEITPSGATRLKFTPDKAGEFTFSCDVVCGGGHMDMVGKLIVTE